MKCGYLTCPIIGKFRCSRCHIQSYCSKEHQKLDWKLHKVICRSVKNNSSINECLPLSTTEKRECRCMFCGDKLILASEEEAVDHMRVCSAFQGQLQSTSQFTLPTQINELIDKKGQV